MLLKQGLKIPSSWLVARGPCQNASPEPVLHTRINQPEETHSKIKCPGPLASPRGQRSLTNEKTGRGGRVPLGKENILTYLLCVLELNIEPAGLDHCLTCCPQRKRRWKKQKIKKGKKKQNNSMMLKKKASFRRWVFQRMTCSPRRTGTGTRRRKTRYFQPGLLPPTFRYTFP